MLSNAFSRLIQDETVSVLNFAKTERISKIYKQADWYNSAVKFGIKVELQF